VISTWTSGIADSTMPEQLLLETCEKVRRHPWWAARARLAMALLAKRGILPPASVLEAGCGWGVNLDSLEKAGYRVTGLDVSRRILEYIDQPKRSLIEADLLQPLPPDLPPLSDAVLALDVIEHIDDDRAAVRRLAELVRPGGLVIVSVPALPDLWSEYDEIQGHRRRYVPASLSALFAGSPLELNQVLWWGAWMVPVLKASRSRSRSASRQETDAQAYSRYLNLPPSPAPLLMKLAYAWEHSRTLRGRLKTGTSLFAIAVRNR
jgi:2-polyprenyl-3-methyl-5-hydroxy-6-metoxy-1,4-benzoquinol methylase